MCQNKISDGEEIENIKGELFANVSHEFKTPLNIILSTMQLINNNIEAEKISFDSDVNLKKYMDYIKQNSYRLLRLVNNLIDGSKIESGYYDLCCGNHNIVSIIEDITLSISPFIETKKINLVFDTDEEEIIISCDPEKIERIMLNLLSNAVKYTKDNGEITVNIKSKKEKILVSIQDNGIGIPEDKINSIFERFERVQNEETKKISGSGIGLSLVKSLVEMHDGKIYVESKLGEGTKFTFELPNKKIQGDFIVQENKDLTLGKVEKCNIEFSDIYKYVG